MDQVYCLLLQSAWPDVLPAAHQLKHAHEPDYAVYGFPLHRTWLKVHFRSHIYENAGKEKLLARVVVGSQFTQVTGATCRQAQNQGNGCARPNRGAEFSHTLPDLGVSLFTKGP